MTDTVPAASFGPVEFLAGGQSAETVFSELEARRSHDVRWREGRAFSLAYYAGPEVAHVAEEAYRRFSGENALNTAAFPSLEQMQREVLGIVGQWLGANDESAGFFTSGGTESLLMAVKSLKSSLMTVVQSCGFWIFIACTFVYTNTKIGLQKIWLH